jgi:peptide-methionine (S)-S-oxide reductase
MIQMKRQSEFATLAGGCFWCTEAVFKRVKGVISVQPGFTGGHVENPSWEEVCTGTTGHAEAVRIEFDPTQITFEELLDVFFRTHDPTTLNQQGNDKGPEYRSAIFYHDENQRKLAEGVKAKLNSESVYGGSIVTQISASTAFYPADDYHKNFYESGHRPDYCFFVIDPKLRKLFERFDHHVKAEYKNTR